MEFEKRKAMALEAISSSAGDKSPKGSLDAPIVPLLQALNQHPSYFTTSSCSGRISILSQPPPPPPPSQTLDGQIEKKKTKKKAGGGSWLFITHDPADPDSVVDVLFRSQSSTPAGALVFRFEPFILAVDCRDVASAQALVAAAISCGFRESGVTNINKRVMVAVRCSLRLEVPLGETGQIMVSPEYVRYLVGVANEKMMANRRRTDGFLQVLQCMISPGSTTVETYSNDGQQGCPDAHQESTSDLDAEQRDLLPRLTSCTKDTSTCHRVHSTHHKHNACHNYQEHQSMESAVLYTGDEGTDTSCKSATKDACPSYQPAAGELSLETINMDLGFSRGPVCLSAVKMTVVGEPVEKLFLWGQAVCKFNNASCKQILLFGGFGGLGRHARRNDSLILDPQSGALEMMNAEGPPSPRLGHTLSLVGEQAFVIGGRGDPTQILNDVWVLNISENRWKQLDCTGRFFHPRHRHAAAVIGSKIYVYGGLNNDVIYSCMYVLDTENLSWCEVHTQGDSPCCRHSHSLVAYGSQLFMFGGYDGQKALGDLYSFDVGTCLWKKENTIGRAPYARFSHSMFIYKYYLGVVGGCPVKQQFQEVALLDLRNNIWRHMTVVSISKDLLVRSTNIVVGDDLVILGGGASCYAFGTKFNEPIKIDLRPLIFLDCCTPSQMKDAPITQFNQVMDDSLSASSKGGSLSNRHEKTTSEIANLNHGVDNRDGSDGLHVDDKSWVLQLERKYAKLGKDILKRFGWLDRGRKVYSSQDGRYICLPITEISYAFFQEKAYHSVDSFDRLDACHASVLPEKGVLLSEFSLPMALHLLSVCGGSIILDDVACVRKTTKAPQQLLKEAVCSLIKHRGLSLQLLNELPARWEKLGDIVVLPVSSFKDPIWKTVGEELWPIVAKILGTNRLARQGRVVPNGTRDSALEILLGENGWVDHHENGILYSFDAMKCMFSSGNLSEKLRMAHLDCRDEVVVDLFAGIGYFVLPFLVKAKAKLVYACEWNPHAIKALRHNVQANLVAERCVILEGDNKVTAPEGVADRVCLGLLPTSESSWPTAVRALRPEGGILHVHGNVKDSEESSWLEYVGASIGSIAQSEGYCWDVSIQHVERVKWYGPHIRHLVADVRCKQLLVQ